MTSNGGSPKSAARNSWISERKEIFNTDTFDTNELLHHARQFTPDLSLTFERYGLMSADVAASVSKVAHSASKFDFESVLSFTCFSLWQMDQGYDGPRWTDAIEDPSVRRRRFGKPGHKLASGLEQARRSYPRTCWIGRAIRDLSSCMMVG